MIQGRAFCFDAREVGAGQLSSFGDVPMDVFIELVCGLLAVDQVRQITNSEHPVPPGEEAFVGVAQIGLRFLDDAARATRTTLP